MPEPLIGKHGETIEMPTNADLKATFDTHAAADQIFQDAQAKTNEATSKSLSSLHRKLKEIPTKDETADIVTGVISQLLIKQGKTAFYGVLAIGALVGALLTIMGGFKVFLGILGFTRGG